MRCRTLAHIHALEHPVYDCHMHVYGAAPGRDGALDEAHCDRVIEANDLLGIDISCAADGRLTGDLKYEDFHRGNDRVNLAMARHPGRFLGWCFINPGDPRALEEMDQRIRDEGFIGVKMYNQYRINAPEVAPVLERVSEWQVPVLMHAGRCMDADTQQRQPFISQADHFVEAARQFPEAILIEAHIGGGGDWEWPLKHLREAPSVCLDISGSVVDEWMMDRTVAALGIDRVLFATDMTFEGSVGKALDADLDDEAFSKLMGRNFAAILARRAV
jgi:predicted TIM-barrel fold metal-dependent hydrolase